MTPMFALFWAPDDALAGNAVKALQRAQAEDRDWVLASAGPDHCVFARAGRPLAVHSGDPDAFLVIGELFERDGRPAHRPLTLPADPIGTALPLAVLERYWGRYLFVCRTASGEVASVLRDPSGAFDSLIWRQNGVTILATELPERLMAQFGPRQGLAWDALAALLADPIFGSLTSPIQGVTAIPPGGIAIAGDEGFQTRQLWRPRAFAHAPFVDADFAERELRRRVGLCVAAHAGQGGAILAEVSGGFDSSVVAAMLVEARAPVAAWRHHAIQEQGADERAYAAILGEHLGIPIVQNTRAAFTIDPGQIERSQFGPRPSGFAFDAQYDDDTIALAQAVGATRLFTGFGGDGLFFVSPLPAIARDLYLRRGAFGLLSPEFGDLARWCRRSVWSMTRSALARRHPDMVLRAPDWVASVPPPPQTASHPWLDDCQDLPPAKRRHIEEQVLVQVANSASLRGRSLDLVHPLLSQPIVEHCLRIPVDLLVAGGRDRALARRAFRDRLPTAILERRSKGELSVFYARAFATGLPRLRDYLLGGRLAERGLLSRPKLEASLQEVDLAQQGNIAPLLRAVAVEGWVRRWEGSPGI